MTDARLAAAVEAAQDMLPEATRRDLRPIVEAALAAADAWDREQAAKARCWCITCESERLARLPFPRSLMRGMALCPDCGNKRCPKATHHDNACTGSNDPGQAGSAYGPPPDEPREPRPVPR